MRDGEEISFLSEVIASGEVRIRSSNKAETFSGYKRTGFACATKRDLGA